MNFAVQERGGGDVRDGSFVYWVKYFWWRDWQCWVPSGTSAGELRGGMKCCLWHTRDWRQGPACIWGLYTWVRIHLFCWLRSACLVGLYHVCACKRVHCNFKCVKQEVLLMSCSVAPCLLYRENKWCAICNPVVQWQFFCWDIYTKIIKKKLWS